MQRFSEKCTEKYYFVTYKKNTKDGEFCDQVDYAHAFQMLNTKGKIIHFRYETDKKGRLHLHAVVKFDKNPFFKSFMIKGFSTKFLPVYDAEHLSDYLNKQVHSDEDSNTLVLENYYRGQYAFDD